MRLLCTQKCNKHQNRTEIFAATWRCTRRAPKEKKVKVISCSCGVSSDLRKKDAVELNKRRCKEELIKDYERSVSTCAISFVNSDAIKALFYDVN